MAQDISHMPAFRDRACVTAEQVVQNLVRMNAERAGGGDGDFFSRAQDDTWPTGVNDNVDITGCGIYGVGCFAEHIELNEGLNDAEVTPQFIPVYYPDSVGTYPFALNNQRVLAGAYMSTDGLFHGFVAMPIF